MDTSNRRLPLIIAAVIWVLLLVVHLPMALQVTRLLLIFGIPIAAAFYLRSTNAKRDRELANVFGSSSQRRVADESSVRIGKPEDGVTPMDVTGARTRWPVGVVVMACVIFGVPVAINASENNTGLLTLCLVLWALVMGVTWARVARWTSRRGPLGGRFDVGPAGILVHAHGASSLVRRADIHLVEIYNSMSDVPVTSGHKFGMVMVGVGAAGVAGAAAYGSLAGVNAVAGASHAKAQRINTENGYQIRYRVAGKAYPLAGGLSLATAQEIFWHLTDANTQT